MSTFLILDNDHYVYCHTRQDTNSVFYIGKGSGDRLNGRQQRNVYWKNIVAKCGGYKSEIIINGLTEIEAYSFEREIIQIIRSQNDIELCNLVGGGRGGSFNPSEETRLKQRNAKLGRKLSEEHKSKIGLAGIGRKRKPYVMKLTDEQRKHKSELARNQVWTEERKNNISKARTGLVQSEETKRKISEAKRGVKMSPEHCANVSLAVKAWWDKRKADTGGVF